MKTGLRLFFLTIFCVLLAREVAYPATISDARPQEQRTSIQSEDHQGAAKKDRPHSSAGPAKPNHLPLPRNQKHSASGKAADAMKANSTRAASPGNGVPAMTNGASKTRPVQPQITSRPFIPASKNVRHRNPNPATVDGSTISKAPNTAAINGSHAGRKR